MKIYLAALGLFAVVFAQDANASTTADLFKGVTNKAPKCFGREYSKAHMASHPKQTVEQLKVKLLKYSDSATIASTGIKVEARLKGQAGLNYTADMSCFDNEGAILCAIECDGGSVNIKASKSGSLQLKNNGFVLTGGCGEDDTVTKFLEATRGGDDLFELTSLPAEFCGDSNVATFEE